MSFATVSSAGIYSKTIEEMMYSPRSEEKKTEFKDEILLQKSRSVSRLVEKFETCQLDETVEEEEEIQGFYEGIRKTSSPIQMETPKMEVRRKKGSTCSSDSSTSSAPSVTVEMDIYMKIARAKIHKLFPKYYAWDKETLRTISMNVSKMRLDALSTVPETVEIQKMRNIYEKCETGKGVKKEMNVLCVLIFELLNEKVHEQRLSIFEEYLVFKYYEKLLK